MTKIFYNSQHLASSNQSSTSLRSILATEWNLSHAQVTNLVFTDEKTIDELRSENTDTDGGVYGVRFFSVVNGANHPYLVSPTNTFIWDSHKATASDFKNGSAVRGHNGFHAAWPYDLQQWQSTSVDHRPTPVKALVKGYGDLILGDVGWRSQRLEIVACATTDDLKASLHSHYPILWLSQQHSEPIIELMVSDPRAIICRPKQTKRQKLLDELIG